MKHFLVFLLLFIGIGSVTAQNARITGTVKDNTGEAVIGANINLSSTYKCNFLGADNKQ